MDLQKEIEYHRDVPELEEPVQPTELSKFREYAEAPHRSWKPLHRFLGYIHENHPKTILELGCGAGQLTTRLAKSGYHVTALELSPELIQATEHRAEMDGVSAQITTSLGDVAAFDPGDRQFDMVVAKLVLHHVDLDATMRMITRVLQPDGVLVVWEPVAFSTGLQAMRDLTPVTKDISPNERQLTRADLELIQSYFEVYRENLFYLFTRVRRLLPDTKLSRWLISGVERFDALALAVCPPLRYFAGTAILCLQCPRKK